MRRLLVVLAVVMVAVVAGAVVLERGCGDHANDPEPGAGVVGATGSAAGARSARMPAPRGSIAGAIRDARGPLAGARVCADLDGGLGPACATSDARGAYAIDGLLPGRYQISAAAAEHAPGVYRPGGDRRNRTFRLGPGERRTGIDVVLAAGGARLAGVVSDISGGPIAHAQIRIRTEDRDASHEERWGASVEADAAGAFVAWLAPGGVRLRVTADGYGALELFADAPGELDIRLTPSGSVAGTVVDERGNPVEDATVSADAVDMHPRTRTDAAGHFEIDGLAPGRYDLAATVPSGIAHSPGSVMVALGAHVDGIVLRLHRGAHVSGRIVLADGKTCAEPEVQLHETLRIESVTLVEQPDGVMAADAVPAGRYAVYARCPGYYAPARSTMLDVADRDLDGQVWKLAPGSEIRGHVSSTSGDGVGGASVHCYSKGAHAVDDVITAADGAFACTGLPPGTYELTASTAHAGEATATVVLGTTPVDQELLVDEGATINGIVVDPTGRPVDRVDVAINGEGGASTSTDGSGRFSASVRPGTHEVEATREEVKALGPGQTVTVAAGESASVRLVIPAQTGTIRGTVVDAAGAPVPDAFVDAKLPAGDWDFFDWTWAEHAVLTRPDGTFVLDRLGPGPYRIHAQRRGGGEVTREGVDVGANVKLQLATTGSLAGTVAFADGHHPVRVELTLRIKAPKFYRKETFVATDGAWTIPDLPPGDYTIAAVAPDGFGKTAATLAAGEDKRGIAIPLVALVPVTGRFVDAVTHAPIPDIGVAIDIDGAELGTVISGDDPAMHSDANGAFHLLAPPGGFSLVTMLPGGFDPRVPKELCIPAQKATAPADLGDILVTHCGGKP